MQYYEAATQILNRAQGNMERERRAVGRPIGQVPAAIGTEQWPAPKDRGGTTSERINNHDAGPGPRASDNVAFL